MSIRRDFLTIFALLAIAAPAVPQPAPRPAPRPEPVEAIDKVLAEADAQIRRLEELPPEHPARIAFEKGFSNDMRFASEEIDKARAEIDAHKMQVNTLMLDHPDRLALAKRFGSDAPFAYFQGSTFTTRGRDNDERAYERGQRALDGRRWEEALEAFTQAANGGGTRVDGALYWKAYALAKLGRRDEAMAAIAQLRKTYASSRWLDDTKALEFEMKQASGQKSAPEAEADEDLKLMALNGLMQSDPERALPLLENLLKTSSSAKLKERVLFVLAQTNSPAGRQLLERVARGGAGNPDLQVKAVHYISATSRKNDNRQLLWDIYSKSTDEQVKREVIRGLRESQDKDHLLQIAKTDKDPALRRVAIESLASIDPTLAGEALSSLYGSESDQQIKKQILSSLHGQRNAKAMVELARKENDPGMKREIVSRLSSMKSKEAADYLMELLK